jgi:hypothetical protein
MTIPLTIIDLRFGNILSGRIQVEGASHKHLQWSWWSQLFFLTALSAPESASLRTRTWLPKFHRTKYSQYSNNQPLLGKVWYNAFMSHHHDILRKGKAHMIQWSFTTQFTFFTEI